MAEARRMCLYRKNNPDYGKYRNQAAAIIKVKTEVLSHYGINGNAVCCWKGCDISDIDMLSLDHIENNGAKHRKEIVGTKHRCGGGITLYRKLRKTGYPEGFQTLCHNHQWKKEITRRRELTLSMCEAHKLLLDVGSKPTGSTNNTNGADLDSTVLVNVSGHAGNDAHLNESQTSNC